MVMFIIIVILGPAVKLDMNGIVLVYITILPIVIHFACKLLSGIRIWFMVFNATFNNISVIS